MTVTEMAENLTLIHSEHAGKYLEGDTQFIMNVNSVAAEKKRAKLLTELVS